MESEIPKNSMNTPLENVDQLQYFKSEYNRLRENNLNLKLQIIEDRKKLFKILEIINKK
jgi:hypothetical protein|tara:strand:- start:272 stop:448 length:177 start_codon:yes stop_codon:yes gene_type:complete